MFSQSINLWLNRIGGSWLNWINNEMEWICICALSSITKLTAYIYTHLTTKRLWHATVTCEWFSSNPKRPKHIRIIPKIHAGPPPIRPHPPLRGLNFRFCRAFARFPFSPILLNLSDLFYLPIMLLLAMWFIWDSIWLINTLHIQYRFTHCRRSELYFHLWIVLSMTVSFED